MSSVLDKAGLSRGNLARWKTGVTPTMKNLEKIADVLETTVYNLLDQEPDREYETVLDVLNLADIKIWEAGFSMGGPDGDVYCIAPLDADEDEYREIEFGQLVQIINKVLEDAEIKKKVYIQSRLNIELF